LLNYNIGKFPQPVSLLFFGQSLSGYNPVTLGYIDIEFAGYVGTINDCHKTFLKLGLPLNWAPMEGQIFR